MTCERFKEYLADSLIGQLPNDALHDFEAHQQLCAACREEADTVHGLWASLGLLRAEDPSPAGRARFYQMLEAYRHGLEAHPGFRERLNRWLSSWWPAQPLWQATLSLVLLVAGLGGGYLLHAPAANPASEDPKLAQLTEEVRNMRQLVTLSLLQQQSASERLKGVNWSYRIEEPDNDVLSALLHTLNHDPSVDVRLAAVDALYKFADSSMVRRNLRQSLQEQPSPLVQIAIADMLTDLRDRQTGEVFRALLKNENVNPDVRQRIERNLSRIEQ